MNDDIWKNREKEEDVLARLKPGQKFFGAYYEDGTPLITQDTIDIYPMTKEERDVERDKN